MSGRGRWTYGVVAGLGLVLGLAAGPVPAAAEPDFTVTDERVTDASGLARDVEAGCYWTVGADEGGGGRAYALRPDGTVQATVAIRTTPEDPTAVALHDGTLYLADLGDRAGERSAVTVYFFPRPELDRSGAADRTVGYRAYDFAYPDRPRNATALLVDRRGRLVVVTTGPDAGIYVAPRRPSRTAVNRLRRVARAPAGVTDGTVLPDGGLALRTAGSVVVLNPTTYAEETRTAAPPQPQGEALAVSLDGTRLLLGGSGSRAVLAMDLPGAAVARPAVAGPTAPAEGSAGPPAGVGGVGPGPWWAAVLALAAGAGVAVARRR